MSNNISVAIPQEVIKKVTDELHDVKKQLAPYLHGLTKEERGHLFKMGDKSVATVSKVKSYLDTNPEFAPNYMDIEEFRTDERVISQLKPVLDILMQICSDTDDTVMLAGSEALDSAMFYYGSVKDAAKKGIPAAKPIYEDLKERFAKRRKAKPDTKE